MVIQRWQTVFLFVTAVFMALFTFMPYATTTVDGVVVELAPSNSMVYMIVNILTIIIAFISIFMYRDLRKQVRTVKLVMLLIVCAAVTGALLLFGPNAPSNGVELCITGGLPFLIGSLIFSSLALRGIRKDQKILASNDRIR